MNGFDVQAIGWIVTRDLCSEAARRFLGLNPRFDRAALEELARRWANVNETVLDDQRTMSLTARIMRPRRTPLSNNSVAAMKAFVQQLVTLSPGLYDYQALRSRCLGECVQLVASFVCCLLFGLYASPDAPMFGRASLCFFLVGCWFSAVTFQLYVACRLIGRLEARRAAGRGDAAIE
ncbi:MAG TPA: hypothetical protein VGA51_03320 [Casimicrobiaceae bacterium]